VSPGTPKPAALEPPSPWTVRVAGPGAGPDTAIETGSGAIAIAAREAVLARRVASADSFWGRFMGLMGRASLPDDEGLYIPGNSIHMFFMRFPIDAVFVGQPDASGARPVVACRPGLRPWTGLVMPVRDAAGVVELPVGTIARAGIQAGAELRFETPVSSAAVSGSVAASPPISAAGPTESPEDAAA
jgi:uncharacterized membrane protein (UPF0127 family)